MMQQQPVHKEIILLGGGHTHVIVIRKWAMNPVAGVRITLVSEQAMTPYSGMLPGLVAGHYSYRQSHIDLPRLCQWAGVRFIEQRATGVDPERKLVQLPSRPPLHYDILSIDTGGAPSLEQIKGAAEFATPVKPVSSFYARWKQIEQRFLAADNLKPLTVAVVGAGAGGFEIVLAMHHRVIEAAKVGRADVVQHRFHWIIRGKVLPGATPRVKRMAIAECERKGIILEYGFDVAEVEPVAITSTDGKRIELDEVLWCTEARAASWPAQSGLACTDNGFLRLNDHLQSVSHDCVFAAGDVAIQENHPRPRAGVFAVRQGPVLFRNLQNAVLGKPLKAHIPQQRFLTLLSLGHQAAIASRGMFSWSAPWVWRWKDHIDQTFMDRFNALPSMEQSQASLISRLLTALPAPAVVSTDTVEQMRCSGCGSKVPGDVLQSVLSASGAASTSLSTRDDIALLPATSTMLAQSVDQLRAMVADPNLFARIATLHALSDLYASGVAPQSAMVMATLPFASEPILRSDLQQLMDGIVSELDQAGCILAGGHTTEAAELSLGLVVNGFSSAEDSVLKSGVQDGQALVLTKPLGVGVLLAAHMRGELPADLLQNTLDIMLQSNRTASAIAIASGATAMTDVTGFGLIGHLSEMLSQSGNTCVLDTGAIPLLPGAARLANAGQHSSLFNANTRYRKYCDAAAAERLVVTQPLVFDPQTAGGLLFTLSADQAENCIEQLKSSGYDDASIIGSTGPSLSDRLTDGDSETGQQPIISLR